MKILETIDSGKKTFLYAVEYYLQRATSILIHLFTSSLIKYVKVVWNIDEFWNGQDDGGYNEWQFTKIGEVNNY